MATELRILGTQLPILLSMNPAHTVRALKVQIQSDYSVPIHRQTLRRLNHDGQLMLDDQTLEFYHIMDGHNVSLLLSLQPLVPADASITVFLRSEQPQFTDWWADVHCKETTTLAEFKRLAADQLRWDDPVGMAIFRSGHAGPIDVEGNMGRILREFLIMHHTVLIVEFRTNAPQNGVLPHEIQPYAGYYVLP